MKDILHTRKSVADVTKGAKGNSVSSFLIPD